MRLAGPLQPQVVVAGREAAQFEHARSAIASGVEPVGADVAAAHLEQREFVAASACRPCRGTAASTASPAFAWISCAVGVPVGRQRPGVRGALRARSRSRSTMSASGPSVTRPRGVGLQRDLHRLLEVAVLERQLHRPVRLRLAGPAEQLDHVVGAELRQVQVLDLVGPVDLVEGERLRRGQVDRLAACSRLFTFAVSVTVERREPRRARGTRGSIRGPRTA